MTKKLGKSQPDGEIGLLRFFDTFVMKNYARSEIGESLANK